MSINFETRPVISIDLKKHLIRIHRNTLHSIGDPDYVLLLVNPEERTLAILQSNRFDPKAHRIKWNSIANKKSFELYSRSLVGNLCDVSSNLEENQLYRIYGEIIPEVGMVRFFMTEAVQLSEVK